MRIVRYAEPEKAKKIQNKIKENGGYCPCVLPSKRTEDHLCMCKNFLEAPAGTICHCGLYQKVED
jgi:hypothetical protein